MPGLEGARGRSRDHARDPVRELTALGIVFTAERPPEELPAFASAAEQAGFDELWVWEDCFYAGGIAASATALAATGRIAVGLGIMPAVFRNPVASAMEIATLARLHPGRFIAGLGHGVPSWMAQIGALPARPVRALEEVTLTVRRLLAGERVTMAGDHVHVTGAQLLQPPAEIPPVVLGVRRPAGLRAAGRSADGTILCEPASPEYIAWARRRIDEGRAEAGRTDPHRIIVFVKCRIDSDRSAARSWVAEILQNVAVEAQLAPLGLGEELDELRALGDPAALPDELVDRLTASGTPDEVAAALAAIEAAAVDSIVLVPIGPNPDEQLRLVADTLVRA